ncbi:PREDICTED: HIG1 domain family member 1B isoform X1 [Gavialis gangeticus]|uniref:HIG1 domain family member 1B isoform X1 n=1 Tax=Gavialis gangeticus TaxID=94835 RepID=UPI00092FB91B|nr:PREDICTED: HIG1 domain family member 1B isoform X1 [Gavialis gangeticus]
MSTSKSQWIPEHEDTAYTKLLQKVRESPFMLVGLGSFVMVVAYGVYLLKVRGKMKMSLHLIHTQMAAQACVVGAITLGTTHTMYKDYLLKPSTDRAQK